MSNDWEEPMVLQDEGARNLFQLSFLRSSRYSENDKDVGVKQTRMSLS